MFAFRDNNELAQIRPALQNLVSAGISGFMAVATLIPVESGPTGVNIDGFTNVLCRCLSKIGFVDRMSCCLLMLAEGRWHSLLWGRSRDVGCGR